MLYPKAVDANESGVQFEDSSTIQTENIIWATGYRSDYSWIQIPSALNEMGSPIHEKGVSPIHGLFFLGLPWQSCRGSALMDWVSKDAEFLAQIINVR